MNVGGSYERSFSLLKGYSKGLLKEALDIPNFRGAAIGG